jgi:4-amino-4-deoxy-L-arabinose transferase-like glycosyltransferase
LIGISPGLSKQVSASENLFSRGRFFMFCIVAGIASLFLFAMLDSVPLFNPDEGLYAEPAREMLDTGEYVTTMLNYAVRFTKPPLAIWAMVLGYKLFGVSEFGARFFIAASAFILIMSVYTFSEKYLGIRAAILSVLVLLTSPLFLGVAREAITDMPLSLFIAGSLMAFFFAYREKSQIAKWSGFVLVALAIMTKGPVGFLLPAVILAAFYFLTGQTKSALKFFNLPLGLALVALIALPWFVIEIAITKGAYFNEFIMRENFARFTSVIDAHKGPPWYHIAVVLGGLFPWSIVLVATIYRGIKYLIGSWKEKLAAEKSVFGALSALRAKFENWPADKQVLLLSSITGIVVVAFFSASVSKLLPYTLPAFPAFAMLIACEIERVFAENKRKPILIVLGLLFSIYALAGTVAPFALQKLRDAPLDLPNTIGNYGLVMAFFVVLAFVFALIFARTSNRSYITLAIFGTALFVVNGYFGCKLLPQVSRAFEGDVPDYAHFASLSGEPILVHDLRKPGITFYAKRAVLLPADLDAVHDLLHSRKAAYILTRTRDLKDLPPEDGFKVVASDSRFALLHWRRSSKNQVN